MEFLRAEWCQAVVETLVYVGQGKGTSQGERPRVGVAEPRRAVLPGALEPSAPGGRRCRLRAGSCPPPRSSSPSAGGRRWRWVRTRIPSPLSGAVANVRATLAASAD